MEKDGPESWARKYSFGKLRDVKYGQDKIMLYGTKRDVPISLEASGFSIFSGKQACIVIDCHGSGIPREETVAWS